MPLQKQNISLTLDASVDTKRDEFLTDGTAFLAQENARFQKTGAIIKRKGLDGANSGLSTLVSGGFSPKRIISDNKQVFLSGQAGAGNQCNYTGSKWVQFGSTAARTNSASAQIELIDSFGGNPFSNSSWVDYYNGKYLVSAGQQYFTNSFTSKLLAQPQLTVYSDNYQYAIEPLCGLTAGNDLGLYPRAFWTVSGGTTYASMGFYADASTDSITVAHFSEDLQTNVVNTNATISPAATYKTAAGCVKQDRSGVCFFAPRNATAGIAVTESRPDGTTLGGNFTPTYACRFAGDIIHDGTFYYLAYSRQSATDVVIVKYNAATNTEVSATFLSAISAYSNSTNISLALRGSTLICAFGAIDTPTTSEQMYVFSINTSTLVATQIYSDSNIAPVARPYVYNSKIHIPFARNTTVFAENITATVGILRIEDESTNYYSSFLASGFYDRIYNSFVDAPGIGNSIEISSGIFAFTCLETLRTDVTGTAGSTRVSRASLIKANLLNSNAQYGSVCNLGTNLVEYAGESNFYDGTVVAPIGFNFRPYIGATVSSSGGLIAAGSYSYAIYFERTDSFGNVTRSELSNFIGVTTTGSTSSVTVTTLASKWLGEFTAVLCRTKASGSIYFIVQKKTVSGVGSVSFTDTSIDSTLTVQVYTTGGLLENTPPPPTRHATVHQNRVWIVPADEKDRVYYSKKLVSGEMPSFSVFQYFEQSSTIPNVRDDIVATGSVVDKLIILRENSCHWIGGDGALETGAGSTLTEPELISQDVGCSELRSVIQMPLGLMFKSNKGIYLINGGLRLKYIGDRVEAYNSEEVIASTIIPEKNCVAFATVNRILVYDYLFDKWSEDTVSNIQDIAAWNNKLVVLTTSGKIGIEGASYQDAINTPAEDISMRVVTGWLKLSGIQDFGRIYRLLILGRYQSAHTLTAKVYYDYNPNYVETYTITPDPAQGTYQFKIHLAKQKCESIKIEIYDAGTGESMQLTGITLEVGVKQGSFKGNSNKQY